MSCTSSAHRSAINTATELLHPLPAPAVAGSAAPSFFLSVPSSRTLAHHQRRFHHGRRPKPLPPASIFPAASRQPTLFFKTPLPISLNTDRPSSPLSPARHHRRHGPLPPPIRHGHHTSPPLSPSPPSSPPSTVSFTEPCHRKDLLRPDHPQPPPPPPSSSKPQTAMATIFVKLELPHRCPPETHHSSSLAAGPPSSSRSRRPATIRAAPSSELPPSSSPATGEILSGLQPHPSATAGLKPPRVPPHPTPLHPPLPVPMPSPLSEPSLAPKRLLPT